MSSNNPKFRIQFNEEALPQWYSLLIPIYIFVCGLYLFWRFRATVYATMLWFAVPLFIVDIYNVLTTIIHLLVSRKIVHPLLPRLPLRNKTVDVFIPTYNEPEEIDNFS